MNTRASRRTGVRNALVAFLIVLCAASALQGCGGGADKNGKKVMLIIGGYTAPREAYGKAVTPVFQK